MFKGFLMFFGIILFLGPALLAEPQKGIGNIQSEDGIKIEILQGEVDGYPLFASINSSLKEYSRKGDLPWFVSVSTKFLRPSKNGMPEENEFSGLNDWEDLVEARIGKVCRYAYLGHVTYKGSREVLFYVDSREAVESALKRLQGEQKTLKFDFGVSRDDRWESVAIYFKAKPN